MQNTRRQTLSAKKKASPAKTTKNVYAWGAGRADGDGTMRDLLGGKGANLAEMTRIGLPVPPGFTITTEVCRYYFQHEGTYPANLDREIRRGIRAMEKIMECRFGDPKALPLLVSVRSGSRDSMPGMMDTILNLGLNDQTVLALANATKNERFAWDCYRRFIQMYGDVVLGVQKREGEDHEPFEEVIHGYKNETNRADLSDSELTASDLKEVILRFKQLVLERTGRDFPEDPWDQLYGAIGAVFRSWMNDRAMVYRNKYHIPHEWGTGVSVQAMVYGNTGEKSGSGVAFTRNPATGAKEFYGEFLTNAQGEDVVAGVRTPRPVSELRKQMPEAHRDLLRVAALLENHFRDLQDIEFTIQDGRLFLLQTRNGKRSAAAALKVSTDLEAEGLIDWEKAVLLNPADQLDQLLAPVFDAGALSEAKPIATGLPAGPGAASGRICLNAERAVAMAAKGESVLLVRVETSPEDLRGMIAATGTLTAKGGVSSHAALVARQMGKVCVCGARGMSVDYAARSVRIENSVFREGDFLSIDGTTGKIYAGEVPSAPSEIVAGLLQGDPRARKTNKFRSYQQLMKWCDQATRVVVRANADNAGQTKESVAFGAVGIGLVRTEHMFFEGERIDAIREMILADTMEGRQSALKKILPYQRADFEGIFRALAGRPATIRLLDPPLHEFLPGDKSTQAETAKKLGLSLNAIRARLEALHEVNPMLGHRGCRLGIAYPEITATQAEAIFEAAAAVTKEGISVQPEIMIPLVGYQKEFDLQAAIIHRVAGDVQKARGVKIAYRVGTMIEVPRGALTADEIARSAEFFSFGTNDLTQTTLGLSRDDMGSFLPTYLANEIFPANPFAVLDQTGVGSLISLAIKKSREVRPDMKLGVCGEHGGDPRSIEFFHAAGLDYVSCSPYRVPVARLAAAQAAIREKQAAAG